MIVNLKFNLDKSFRKNYNKMQEYAKLDYNSLELLAALDKYIIKLFLFLENFIMKKHVKNKILLLGMLIFKIIISSVFNDVRKCKIYVTEKLF